MLPAFSHLSRASGTALDAYSVEPPTLCSWIQKSINFDRPTGRRDELKAFAEIDTVDLALTPARLASGELPRADWDRVRYLRTGFGTCSACEQRIRATDVAVECELGGRNFLLHPACYGDSLSPLWNARSLRALLIQLRSLMTQSVSLGGYSNARSHPDGFRSAAVDA